MRRVKKSRNGCARCKSKRVKCGEERPHCHRCTRLGVRCPGYVQSFRWVTELFDNTTQLSDGTKQSNSNPSPEQPEFGDPIPESSLALNGCLSPISQSTPQQSSGPLGETNVLCDGLWDLQNNDLLPGLTDICAPSLPSPGAEAAAEAEVSVLGYGLSADSNVPEASSLVFPLAGLEQEHQEDDHGAFRHFAPSTIVRNYPPPRQNRHEMSIHQPLNNPSWTLIEYYFKEVAALFSSYDSQMNPFRTTVSRLWGSSLAICRAMQSMAAATLVNDFPQFGPIGLKMRNEAIDIITNEAAMDDKSLLALLMLGQTASWHDPSDLGVPFFNLLRKHLNDMSSGEVSECALRRSNNYRFFEEALIYWEMLLSFAADNDAVALSGQGQGAAAAAAASSSSAAGTGTRTDESTILQRVPHPWTGIARDTQFTVQEVGRLVRRERKRIRARTFTSEADITEAQNAIAKAQELEERLLSLAHPSEAEIVCPGDDDTPVWHLLTMAEVYRCTGLLQLYRTFPDLLRRRLPFNGNDDDEDGNNNENPLQRYEHSNQLDPLFSILDADVGDINGMGFPNLDINIMANHTKNEPRTRTSPKTTRPRQKDAEKDPETKFYNTWLTEFALTTLSRLKTIPLESRTRCLQPFLLVASCSELRLPGSPSNMDHHAGNENANMNMNMNISSHAIEVSQTRKFILGRLTSFLHVLPPKPISVCLGLVQEVWARMDRGEEGVYWVDVMIERGWETTMG